MNSGFYAQAVAEYEALGFIAPLTAKELIALADAYLASGDTYKAIIVYRQVLQHNPSQQHVEARLQKAYAVVASEQAFNRLPPIQLGERQSNDVQLHVPLRLAA